MADMGVRIMEMSQVGREEPKYYARCSDIQYVMTGKRSVKVPKRHKRRAAKLAARAAKEED